MSDTRRVENDTRNDRADVMRALSDTEGLSVPEKAEFWLQGLAWVQHRGRHDTWGAARDRAADKAKLPVTLARRIWQRFETLDDVSGKALLKLMLAYEEACQRNEDAVAAYRAERLKLKAQRYAVDSKRAQTGVGTDAARD